MLQNTQSTLPDMLETLHAWCGINSGSHNIDGLKTMHKVLKNAFMPIADEVKSYACDAVCQIDMEGKSSTQDIGDILYIRKRPELANRILLCGHMDTVYDANHPFQSTKSISSNKINGPGVADMKGGLIVMHRALLAFEKTSVAKNIGWDVLINADEELGSQGSMPHIEQIAKTHKLALVYEPTVRPDGALAKNRRGSGKFTIIARGKSAHAGRAFKDGRNAIVQLSHAVLAIHELNQRYPTASFNVGKIAGGNAVNMVPDVAVCKLDIRITNESDTKSIQQELQSIVKQYSNNGFCLKLHGEFTRPVKQVNLATKALYHQAQQVAYELGLPLDWEDSGGCCDGNNLSALGLGVLDTMGVRGGEIHSSNEYIITESLIERTALTTRLLEKVARDNNI